MYKVEARTHVNTDSKLPNGLFLNDFYIPEEVLVYMLTFLDARELLKCRLICRCWKELIDNYTWKEKIIHDEYISLSGLTKLEKSRLCLPSLLYYIICSYDPFNKNLLKNHCGQENEKHWELLRGSFGDENHGWHVEALPVGAEMLPPESDDFDGHTCCFVTSYTSCKMEQVIDLSSLGFYDSLLDIYQPVIVASEWYAGRFDCGCKYTLRVALFAEDGTCISVKEEIRTVEQWEGRSWNKVEMRFENYGPNVRRVVFCHEGKDTLFWRGHYGSKMSGAVVKLLFPKHAFLNSCIPDE